MLSEAREADEGSTVEPVTEGLADVVHLLEDDPNAASTINEDAGVEGLDRLSPKSALDHTTCAIDEGFLAALHQHDLFADRDLTEEAQRVRVGDDLAGMRQEVIRQAETLDPNTPQRLQAGLTQHVSASEQRAFDQPIAPLVVDKRRRTVVDRVDDATLCGGHDAAFFGGEVAPDEVPEEPTAGLEADEQEAFAEPGLVVEEPPP